MIHAYFENLVTGIESKLEAHPEQASARKIMALETARLGRRLFSGEGNIAWCGVLVPFDLLNAMGVTACYAEFVGALLASTGAVGQWLEVAERNGFASDTCGYHRSVMGAALEGLMPVPDFLIATDTPCSGGLATVENLARLYGKDLFVIHLPLRADVEGVRYLADQFREMTEFVAEHTGRALDPEALRAAIARTNEARALIKEVFELAQAVPTPARRRDMANFALLANLHFGTDACVRIGNAYRDEFTRKVEAGLAGIPGEQVRLLWVQNRIQFKQSLESLLEEAYQAAIVIDELNDIPWEPIDPDDPYTGLALRALSNPLTGSIELRLERLAHLARAYRVDGALHPCHWGCRQGAGARGLVEAGLRKIGVPVLNLEVDCIDPRNFAEGQLQTRIQAFVEMLLEQKARSGASV